MRVMLEHQSIYEQSFSEFNCGLLLIQKAESRGFGKKLQNLDSMNDGKYEDRDLVF